MIIKSLIMIIKFPDQIHRLPFDMISVRMHLISASPFLRRWIKYFLNKRRIKTIGGGN